MLAIKSVRQTIPTNTDLLQMTNTFRQMVNHCIRIGLENNCSSMKRLSKLAYHKLNEYDIMSTYKLTAISQASGRLSQMKQSIKRGRKTKSPYVRKPFLTNCYGLKIKEMLLTIPYKPRQPINILLNSYTTKILSDPSLTVRSITITGNNTLSLSYSKDVNTVDCTNTVGIDRNIKNITVGNHEKVVIYDTKRLPQTKERYRHVISSFKRNDARIRRKITSKLGKRQRNRIQQLIHKTSKDIVQRAKREKTMIIFENITGIRKLYRRGNGQGRSHRSKMNSWPFYELQRQVQYKAQWEGIQVKFVDPRCTSTLCPRCGKRLQGDRELHRKLWCSNCRKVMDRDVVAAMNIAYKGWLRFVHPKGDTNEAMVQEPNFEKLVILKVDVLKSRLRNLPET